MSDFAKFVLGIFVVILLGVLAIYLMVAYFIALIDTSNMTCPHAQHYVVNPWSVGTSGRCES